MINISFVEWLGYIASLIILISLLNSSIIKLRWINLIGAILFSIYGVFLGSLPVAFMNGAIAIIDIYYLIKIYSTKDNFQLLELKFQSNHSQYFIDSNISDIEKIFKKSTFNITSDTLSFYVFKNMTIAGMFIAKKHNNFTLDIQLDYVTSEYRDFKIGKFIFETNKNYFLDRGFNTLISTSHTQAHTKYLLKMGFTKHPDSNTYTLVL